VRREADELVDALRVLAQTLRDGARTSAELLDRIEAVLAQRRDGVTHSEIVRRSPGPLVVELLSEHGARLQEAGSRVRRAEARALRAEGATMTEIARLFGVSPQRISELLRV